MITINLNNDTKQFSIVKQILTAGIFEEMKKIQFALNKSKQIVQEYEEKYQLKSDIFLEKFKNKQISENEDTFQWWAELKLSEDLEEKLKIANSIELCH